VAGNLSRQEEMPDALAVSNRRGSPSLPKRFHDYSVYGISLRSQFVLPHFRAAGTASAPWVTISKSASALRIDNENSGSWFFQKRFEDGSVYLRWSSLFEFLVSADGHQILARPLEKSSPETFSTYLLGQVLSFALIKRGLESLHSFGASNLRVIPKLVVLHQADHGVSLAVVPTVILPTRSMSNAYFDDAGVGFALPSKTVVDVYNQLTGPEHKVSRGSIGIMFDAVENPAIARVYGSGSGVTVSSVVAGSPADQAGLKVGDTITSVDGKKVSKGADLVADIASRKAGSKVTLSFLRNGKTQETAVTIADRSKLFAARLGDEQDSSDDSTPKQSKFGVTVRKVTPEMADRLDMPAGKGVIVQDVKPGSFAEDVNLGRGDIVLEINRQPVNSEDDFSRLESSLKSGQDVVFLVRQRGSTRQDGTIFLAGTLP